jgi:hypothetical protein
MSKDFLFINRSTKTTSRSPTESQQIASHAQKGYQRKLRAQQIHARQSRTSARASLRASSGALTDFSESSNPSASTSEEGNGDRGQDEGQLQLTPPDSPHSSINEYALSVLPLDRGAFEILQYFLNVSGFGI